MRQSLIKMLAIGLIACAGSVFATGEEATNLGDIDFPNSGSEAAQEPFLRGVKALHSFWFEEAEEAFRNAQEVDPDFALAYWGEAMSHNHPLWAEQDVAKAREVLSRLGKTRKQRLEKAPTDREKIYLDAIETLYAGSADKLTRDKAYEAAMAKLAATYPDDKEAQAFHALSLLGLVRPGDQGFSRQMKAGAKALRLFQEAPNHPGAAHYVIHSFDDPEHAPLALPAAERYAKIAPEAHHALHMPTHIFVQHGMWDRVAESNLSAFNASAKWVERKNLSETKKDFHSWQWRTYANLQRGIWDEAHDALGQTHFGPADREAQSLAFRRSLYAINDITPRCQLAPGTLLNVPTSGHPGGSISSGRFVAGILFDTLDYDLSQPDREDAAGFDDAPELPVHHLAQ